MSLRMENAHRSNHSIFLPQNFGSPFNDAAEHISGLVCIVKSPSYA